MGRLPDGGVVHVEVAADGAHDDVAGIQSHANANRDPVLAAHDFRVALHRLLHPKCRVARPHRVILVRDRCAEQRHDPVAHYLIDRALVAVDGLHHQLEHWIKDLARFLGVTVGEQLHGTLEVREEHRDLFALPLQRGFRGHDLLGEVLGRVGLWRGNPSRRRCSRKGATALTAELLRGGVRRAAGWARSRQPGSTLPTELHGGKILVLAPRAVHAASPPPRGTGPVSGPRTMRADLTRRPAAGQGRRFNANLASIECANRIRGCCWVPLGRAVATNAPIEPRVRHHRAVGSASVMAAGYTICGSSPQYWPRWSA